MAYAKELGTGTRVLSIIPSDICKIPFPGNLITSSTNTGGTAAVGGVTELIDATQDFIKLGVKTGDIVYVIGGGATDTGGGTVKTVVNSTTLMVNTPDPWVAYGGPNFGVGGLPYQIFKDDDKPCMIYNTQTNKFLTVSVNSTVPSLQPIDVFPGSAGAATIANPVVGFQVNQVYFTGTGAPYPGAHWLNLIAVW